MKFEQNWFSGFRGEAFENVNGCTDGRTDDGQKVITIAHPEHSSGELKKKNGRKKELKGKKERNKRKERKMNE